MGRPGIFFIDALRWLIATDSNTRLNLLLVVPYRPGRSKPRIKKRHEKGFQYRFKSGREKKEGWKQQYQITLEFYNLAAEFTYLNGNFEEMEKRAKRMVEFSWTNTTVCNLNTSSISSKTETTQSVTYDFHLIQRME